MSGRARDGTTPAETVAPVTRCGAAGSELWQPALVQLNGSGGSDVKLSRCGPVGAKCGV